MVPGKFAAARAGGRKRPRETVDTNGRVEDFDEERDIDSGYGVVFVGGVGGGHR